jgi:hypothetical protein
MKLLVGDRLSAPSPAGPPSGPAALALHAPSLYRVTGIVQETRWYGLYEGKKVFHNFNFKTGSLEEAADEECLDVFLKTIVYPRLDDREFVKVRRDHARFEAKRCLGLRKTNLLPEPIDLLEVPNEQDEFTFPRPGQLSAREPVLVFAKVHALPVARWLQERQPALPRILRLLADLLGFVSLSHDEGLLLTGLGPVGVWVDDMDRLHYLATDTMIEAARQEKWRDVFPADRYPAGFSAPETSVANTTLDVRADLYSWAALAYFLLSGESPVKIAREQGAGRHARFTHEHFARLHRHLEGMAEADVAGFGERLLVGGPRFVRSWPDGFLAGLSRCLEQRPENRPGSVEVLLSEWHAPRPRPVIAAPEMPVVLATAPPPTKAPPPTVAPPPAPQEAVVYDFRGVSRSWEDTLRYACQCLFAPVPDPEAARSYLRIAAERLGQEAAADRLARALAEEAARPGEDFRSPAWAGLQHAIAQVPAAQAITMCLLTADLPRAAELGLGIFTVLREPPERRVVEGVVGRLTDPAVPVGVRLDALVVVLRLYRQDEDFSARVAEWFGLGIPDRFQAIELLRQAEERTGKLRAIDSACRAIRERIRFRCPRCSLVLTAPHMARHLWEEHRLILDGQRCREPWTMVRELLDDYRADRNPEHLRRALEISRQADPVQGGQRFAGAAREKGVNGPHLQQLLERGMTSRDR